MNLELIQEINTLKDNNKTYTEIAELTGVARTSVVLSIRLSKIFKTFHSQQISSLNKDIELLKLTIEDYKNSSIQTVAEIKKLNALIDIDYKQDMLVKKDEFKNLEDELVKSKKELDIFKRKLYYKEQYLKNLSFVDKMNILFS